MSAGAFLQRPVVGSVEEDHVEAEPRDTDAADLLTAMRLQPVGAAFTGDRLPLDGQRRTRDAGRPKCCRPLVVWAAS
jgi:hypothetical protein